MKRLLLTLITLIFLLACGGLALDEGGSSLPTAPPPSGGPTQPNDLETATVANVVDGDTIELADGRRVRYIGINTPERNQPYYDEATQANRDLIAGETVQLEFDVETFDQYGRSLAYIWVDGTLVNLEIIRRGFANAFTVPPNVRYDDQLREAEREAREAGRGLWAQSEVDLRIVEINADAPGDDRQNPNGEWIEIENRGNSTIEMDGYTVTDEANKTYTFEGFSVAPGGSFRLYSGTGQDATAELYWGFVDDSVWNNGGDAAFLRDDDGALIDTFAY